MDKRKLGRTFPRGIRENKSTTRKSAKEKMKADQTKSCVKVKNLGQAAQKTGGKGREALKKGESPPNNS